MIKVNKPINLDQLDKEFNSKGLNAILNETGDIVEISLTENNDGSIEKLKELIKKHVAVDENAVREAARAALLDKLGITSDEAKLLLS